MLLWLVLLPDWQHWLPCVLCSFRMPATPPWHFYSAWVLAEQEQAAEQQARANEGSVPGHDQHQVEGAEPPAPMVRGLLTPTTSTVSGADGRTRQLASSVRSSCPVQVPPPSEPCLRRLGRQGWLCQPLPRLSGEARLAGHCSLGVEVSGGALLLSLSPGTPHACQASISISCATWVSVTASPIWLFRGFFLVP